MHKILIPFLFIFSLSTQVLFAEAPLDLSPMLIDEVLKPSVYKGFHGKMETLPSENSKCKNRRRFWSLDWRAELEDVEVDYNPSNPNFTKVSVVMKDSFLKAQHYSQDSSKCLWNGGEGEIHLGRISLSFNLMALENLDFPEIELKSLVFKGLDFRNIAVTHRSVFQFKSEKLPKMFSQYIETNLNGFIWLFFKTDMKKRLDKAIQKEVSRRLKEREEQGETFIP